LAHPTFTPRLTAPSYDMTELAYADEPKAACRHARRLRATKDDITAPVSSNVAGGRGGMVPVADIKRDLPGWPDEIIDDWLLYFANEPDCGWPPPEPLGDHRWAGILGDRPLSWWKEVTWQKETVPCDMASLASKTKGIAAKMIKDIASGAADAVTKRRYQQALQPILNNGAFFRPLVAMKPATGLLVLDGNHRIGAFCGAQILPDSWFEKQKKDRPPIEQEAWIGTHPQGEFPLS
jgi:hypothetical protein